MSIEETGNIEVTPVKTAVPRKRSTSKSKKRTRRPSVKVTTPPITAMDAAVEPAGLEPVPTKHVVTTPWRPARLLELPTKLKKAGMRPRWVRNTKANTLKKESEGWQYVKVPQEEKRLLPKTIQDSLGIDGTVQVREMILMWMPEEMAISRNKYYTDKANRSFTDSKQILSSDIRTQSGDDRVRTYGNITEEREFRRI